MNRRKIRIGLIGCGTIGTEIAKAIDTRLEGSADLAAISDIDDKKAVSLKGVLKKKPAILKIDSLIKKSDFIIEAASAKISGDIVKKAIAKKKDIMIMSVGGIIEDYASLFNSARKAGVKIYLPSGALCGLDGVKAASLGRIDKVELITRKPPAALKGAPFVEKNKIDLEDIRTETVIFEGSANEAIEGFPANINVACGLSIAGVGPQHTRVKVVTSPEYKKNVHEVIVEGEFGRLTAKTENIPSPNNPKTSYLAVLSAIATLKQILEPVKVGT